MKNVLIISGSPRKKGNSQRLCEEFKKGAEDKGNSVELIRLAEKKIGFCKACDVCMKIMALVFRRTIWLKFWNLLKKQMFWY